MNRRYAPICLIAVLFLWMPIPATALSLLFPANAEKQRTVEVPEGPHQIPSGPYADAWMPTETMAGVLRQEAWRIAAPGATTAQLLSALSDQVVAAGWEVIFDCDTETCGGFDFRLAANVLPPPEMHVDLGDFRYMAARGPDGLIGLLVSRTTSAGYVQVSRISPAGSVHEVDGIGGGVLSGTDPAPGATPAPLPSGAEGFARMLDTEGRVVLSDLRFDIGSAQLAPGSYGSLDALADYLRANPARKVALVGHTDSSGALDANIALSKRRAGSVLERLVTDYAIPRVQLAAEGMGYLSPLATNLTPEGRELNRRVEVIITSTE
jgi:outer membrane protein OmpA-like peptidoglycan-associated protein